MALEKLRRSIFWAKNKHNRTKILKMLLDSGMGKSMFDQKFPTPAAFGLGFSAFAYGKKQYNMRSQALWLQRCILFVLACFFVSQPARAESQTASQIVSLAATDPVLRAVLSEVNQYMGKTFAVTRYDTIQEDGKAFNRVARFEPTLAKPTQPQKGWLVTSINNKPPKDMAKALEDDSFKNAPLGYGILSELLAGGLVPAGTRGGLLVYRLQNIPPAALNGILKDLNGNVRAEILVDVSTPKPYVRELRISNSEPFTSRTSYGVSGKIEQLKLLRRFVRAADGTLYPEQTDFVLKARALIVKIERNRSLTFAEFGPLTPLPTQTASR
jgi:hypothetical protein